MAFADTTADMGVLDVMGSARAMRWFRPDPVPWPLLEKVLWAATRATNPNNLQPWDFIVVQDAEVRARLGGLIATLTSGRPSPVSPEIDPTTRRTYTGGLHLIEHFGEVPVMVFICGTRLVRAGSDRMDPMYSAVYAAAQNLLVAARTVGLGAAFTTLHERVEPEVRAVLRIPDDRFLGVTMPIGWPAVPFGPLTRKPLDEVVHHDRW
ncbi:nitroreductase family protein [Pseudofrankia inefficax]|uniref:Nitroreductase n=1 Tax=Pseudofrankia inefficax (strain DSM 45817 / CECT 9037 / DDB 130130 / EuI1c) TaxID=298654 RepID=E3IXV3_PSEI1|nr:nitroreductase family protein [Pseudofrankia inefficax]ADP81408.1 nitroreductase [Pseudofrankia inefficax]